MIPEQQAVGLAELFAPPPTPDDAAPGDTGGGAGGGDPGLPPEPIFVDVGALFLTEDGDELPPLPTPESVSLADLLTE